VANYYQLYVHVFGVVHGHYYYRTSHGTQKINQVQNFWKFLAEIFFVVVREGLIAQWVALASLRGER